MFLDRTARASSLSLCALGLCALLSSNAAAQGDGRGFAEELVAQDPDPWLIIPATRGKGGKWMSGAAEAIAREWERHGDAVIEAEEAAESFERTDSAPAPELSQNDIDRWVERSQAALRYLAHGDYRGARRELQAAQQVADRAAAELNREAARAQQVLDTCLYMVRAYVETKDRAAAKEQARECRRLVPSVEPTAFRHTPEVRELLGQVDDELAMGAPGMVEVQSEPSNCLVRVNGIAFGRTPISDIELPVGTYRLQVECRADRRARVQALRVSSGVNRVRVDARFQQALHSRPHLYLQYEDSSDLARYRMLDGKQVAQTVGASGALVITRPAPSTLRIDLDGEGKSPASVWLPVIDGALMGEDVERAVEALLEGRSADFSAALPMAAVSWYDEQPPASRSKLAEQGTDGAGQADEAAESKAHAGSEGRQHPRPRGQRIAGWSLLGVGGAAVLGSLGLHLYRGSLGDDLIASPSNLSVAQDWQDLRIAVWSMAGLGGAAMLSAMPLALPNRQGVPWWSWLSGGLGLGLTGYAIYEAVSMTDCVEPFLGDRARVTGCVNRGQESGRVALAIAGAAPLLTMPLAYLFRPLRVQPAVTVTDKRALLSLRGSF